MANLIVSYHVYGGKGNPVGQRIWADGRVESFLVSKLEKNDQGVYDYVSVPPDWYPTAQLSAAQLEAVTAAIDEAAVHAIPTEIETVTGNRTDTTAATWQVRVKTPDADTLKVIHVAQWGPLAPEAAPLMPLLVKLHQIINSSVTATS